MVDPQHNVPQYLIPLHEDVFVKLPGGHTSFFWQVPISGFFWTLPKPNPAKPLILTEDYINCYEIGKCLSAASFGPCQNISALRDYHLVSFCHQLYSCIPLSSFFQVYTMWQASRMISMQVSVTCMGCIMSSDGTSLQRRWRLSNKHHTLKTLLS